MGEVMGGHVMRSYTVYLNPSDLERGYAVREWLIRSDSLEAGPVIGQGLQSLEQARLVVPPWADCHFPRSPSDDPTIVEVWM